METKKCSTLEEKSRFFKIQKDEYHFNIGDKRHAIIIFEDGSFKNCEYGGLCTKYCFNDWEFLKSVAEKIIELQEEYYKIKYKDKK